GQTIQGNQAVVTPTTADPNPAADPNAAVLFETGIATFNLSSSGGINTPPVTTTAQSSETVTSGQTVAVSQLFSTHDGDGDAITQYEVYLADSSSGGQPSGSLSQNGNAIASGQTVFLTSLDAVAYTGGSTGGTDNLWLRANDGSQWGNWALVQMNDPGAPAGGGSGQSSIALTLSADGDAQFTLDVNGQPVGAVYDVTAEHGIGTTPLQTQTITVPVTLDSSGPNQVAINFTNPTGASDLYVESLSVDGQTIQGNQAVVTPTTADPNPAADPNAAVLFETGIATFNLSSSGGINTPPVTTTAQSSETVTSGQTVAVSQLFSTHDGDGDAITQYEVYLADSSSGGQPSGSLSQNGNAIASGQNVFLTSLDAVAYTGGSTGGTDNLWLRANDGSQWGNWALVQMNDPGAPAGGGSGQSSIASPPVTTTAQGSETVTSGQTVAVSQLFSTHDGDGDAITQYEVYLADSSSGGQPS